jgi:hypothetical protein
MKTYESVNARPVKRFFVEMLTRDIAIEDAILDLLDNCLDGVLRHTPAESADDRPYAGYWAKIKVDKNSFEIEDNCGGIPWSERDRAFRMGSPIEAVSETDRKPTVGAYGIGMKRAIFKIGAQAIIWTQNSDDNYEISITPEWIGNQDSWDLEVTNGRRTADEDGTLIMIENLHSEISQRFESSSFADDLLDKIQNHYSLILQKGFAVFVNNIAASSKPVIFRFAEDGGEQIRPYMFRSNNDGVEIFLAVGLREPIPDAERILSEQEAVRYSTEYAGWTVICNDRVVLYCNRDELTGWGTGDVPKYHTQFIAISGVVEFRGDARLLPTTTTKRGLDVSKSLYLQVLNRMREGTKIFTDFTNKWKTREEEAKKIVSPIPSINFSELKQRAGAETVKFAATKAGFPGQLYKPKLPAPPTESDDVRLSYFREKEKVRSLGEKLIPNFNEIPDRDFRRAIGEASFDFAYNSMVKNTQFNEKPKT